MRTEYALRYAGRVTETRDEAGPERAVFGGGLTTGESRPRRLGLTRDAVVEAAIALADADGLGVVSMSRVAESLGFKTMSLYRHVSSKEELLLLMHDVASQPATGAPDPRSEAGWRADLERWCHEQQAVLRRHPWIVRIRNREPAGTALEAAWMRQGLRVLQALWLDRGFRALESVRLSERDKLEILLMLYGYVTWEAQYRTQMGRPSGTDVVEPAMGEALRGAVGARFPALSAAIEAGAFDDPFETYGTLEFGVARILDGVERMMDRG
jgi:AcrR family transcriptional regulator